nr:class I SAM-dependent methyltransferase [Streptomyces harenosi]
MVDLLLGELAANDTKRLLSLGCGNAVIEERIAALGYEVLAVDAMPEAVELARRKGLTALQADVQTWSPEPGGWPVVYADGLFGHLYAQETASLPVLARIRDWLAGGGTLVASNDAPRNGAATEAAPGVDAFYWLAQEYLVDQANAAGFSSATSQGFAYERPLSGERHRAVLIARVGS